jgi:hypothetical protein
MIFWQNASSATYLQSRTNKHHKSALFGNQFYDFRATFSSLVKGFWSTNFERIADNIFKKKKDFSFML